MASRLRDLEHATEPLVSLFGNDIQAWTQDQINLNDEIQRLIAQAHADNGCDWDHVLASVAKFMQKYPTVYCNTIEDARPSLETGLSNNSLKYGFPDLLYSIARLVALGTDFDLQKHFGIPRQNQQAQT